MIFKIFKKANHNMRSLSELGFNPDLDWAIVIIFSIVVVFISTLYSVSLFSNVYRDGVKDDDVRVENVVLDRDGLDAVMANFNIKDTELKKSFLGTGEILRDPSLQNGLK